MKFAVFLLTALSCVVLTTARVADVLQPQLNRRSCAKDNLYRTLERLQRESSFCGALLSPNPTVSIPSSIAATPVATISSACGCIVGTSTTTTASTCANTVTITQTLPQVTVTATVTDFSVLPQTTVTVTNTQPPASNPSLHLYDFESVDYDRQWGCGLKPIRADSDFSGFAACGEHQDASRANSGSGTSHTGNYVGRWGNKKLIPVLSNTPYEFSVYYRQLSWTSNICTSSVTIGTNGLTNIDTSDTVSNGVQIGSGTLTTGLTWAKTTINFNTGQYSGISIFISVICNCDAGNGYCGNVIIGYDDISIKPAGN
ncbi:hypothetical protein H072_11323 [Dactylellina haptotyla CBS 200.50]|uniref:CBM-cenC domain-containing protein n=1 Tax=Dactylellina haptotyla (strain CBS 200.50) TaxID=1284197 RepID=S8A2E3_DACHA|nr:hypothetical protein H072_11323 [Dactylellina haptotyla CBS 200.50]